MITLIGTGHVFDLREQIIKILHEKQPEIICVELDEKRYAALMQRKNGNPASSSQRTNASFLYRLLGRFQDSIANQYGIQAGDEMLLGIEFAQSYQRPIAFIDLPADHMFSRMINEMSFTEKIKLIISAMGSMFVSKKQVDKEIGKIEGNIEHYLEQVGDKFPTIKRILIDERNQHMANQLLKAHDNYDHVVAIIGDGHVPGLKSMVKKQGVECESIRLQEIRKKKENHTNSSQASFTIYQS